MYDQFWLHTLAVWVLQRSRRLKCGKQLHHTIHRTYATVAVVSHNCSLSSSSIPNGYLRESTEIFTEGTRLYMVSVMDNIHIVHMYTAYA